MYFLYTSNMYFLYICKRNQKHKIMAPKIEKVDHSPISGEEKYFVVAYYITSDTLSQSNYFYLSSVILSKNACTVGMWKPKAN